jgi:hypothetical protein
MGEWVATHLLPNAKELRMWGCDLHRSTTTPRHCRPSHIRSPIIIRKSSPHGLCPVSSLQPVPDFFNRRRRHTTNQSSLARRPRPGRGDTFRNAATPSLVQQSSFPPSFDGRRRWCFFIRFGSMGREWDAALRFLCGRPESISIVKLSSARALVFINMTRPRGARVCCIEYMNDASSKRRRLLPHNDRSTIDMGHPTSPGCCYFSRPPPQPLRIGLEHLLDGFFPSHLQTPLHDRRNPVYGVVPVKPSVGPI